MTAPSKAARPRPSIGCSVVVLTLNEERNIGDCLRSLQRFDDVHVLDSGSTDRTVAIATQLGATIAMNPFGSFGQQRNWAHEHMSLRHRWVLHLDADERMTDALAAQIDSAVRQDDGSMAGYLVPERTLLHGRWLRHAGQYPRYQARVVHRDRMRFVDHGHGQREHATLPFGHLEQPYDHHAFSHGTEHWLRKHAGYAMREAEVEAAGTDTRPVPELLWAFVSVSGSATEWRRALKALSSRLPLRPTLRWFYVLFVRRGFLDGRAGWQYAEMMKVFQHMIDLCARERQALRESEVRDAAVLRLKGREER